MCVCVYINSRCRTSGGVNDDVASNQINVRRSAAEFSLYRNMVLLPYHVVFFIIIREKQRS